MTELDGLSRQVWEMKYRLRTGDGEPVDATLEDTWRRIAMAAAAPEVDRDGWAARFTGILADFQFLPAGRIVAGAGADRSVTLFNCFVMGRIPDSMEGIFQHVKEAALTLQQGGGIGYDFSTLRPRGAPVHGVGADASGPLSFMDVWDAMCRTIMSAGARRGAMMATLRCDHPDVEAFVDAKRDPARLRMFNLSVLVTDAFMRAVEGDTDWPLVFEGAVFRTVKARALWDRIMRATYEYAEPGVIFIDRINADNNLAYCETIYATNPCVTADTWVHTDEGPRQVRDLVGRPFTALVNGQPFPTGPEGFFATGRKPILKLATAAGPGLRLTADHPVRKVTRRTPWTLETDWVPAGELAPGDEIMLHDHRGGAAWPSAAPVAEIATEAAGYLLGLLVGDGTLKDEAAVLSVWPGAAAVHGGERPGIRGVMRAAEGAARSLRHRADFAGWTEVRGRGEYRLKSAPLRDIAAAFGLVPGRKAVTPAIEMGSTEFVRAFLRGFFDADGSVQGTQAKGLTVRLAQSDLDRLQAVQRMLLRLGIVSTIYRDRRPPSERDLPDGRGGKTAYRTAANHELVIANETLGRFAELVGFADTEKAARLSAGLGAYVRAPNREWFAVTVEQITPDGEAEVFDVAVPGANAFDANGLLVHNCGEQPLPPYGACLLGSVNLARLVRRPFTDEAALDRERLAEVAGTAVRLLDNVVDISRFPLPQQEAEAKAKRRIGLGITGLADALILCGVRYGSARAVALTQEWLEGMRRAAYLASADLAAEKGAFPLYDAKAMAERPAIRRLPADVRARIAEKGLRNALLTSIAPTGTISLFAENVSSGIEPVFAFEFQRTVLLPDGGRRTEPVSDYAYRLFRRQFGDEVRLPDSFVDVAALSPADHLAIQAAAQPYVDSSISKTINCPADIDFDGFKDVYAEAYRLGCKGCTTYRPNPVTGAVLSTVPEREAPAGEAPTLVPAAAEAPGDASVVYMTRPLDRPEALPGRTYKLRWPDSDHALYVTMNDIVQDGRRRPFEIFINSRNMEHYAWTVALTRMISAVFRRGGDVSFVVGELKAVFDPRGGHWMGGRYVPSLLAAIGEIVERHMIDIGFLPALDRDRGPAEGERLPAARAVNAEAQGNEVRRATVRQCPACGSSALVRQEDCDLCTSCGFSRCT